MAQDSANIIYSRLRMPAIKAEEVFSKENEFPVGTKITWNENGKKYIGIILEQYKYHYICETRKNENGIFCNPFISSVSKVRFVDGEVRLINY